MHTRSKTRTHTNTNTRARTHTHTHAHRCGAGASGRCTRSSASVLNPSHTHTHTHTHTHAHRYDASRGCKWQMHEVKRFLVSLHGEAAVATCLKQIDDVIILTLQSVQKIMINDKVRTALTVLSLTLTHSLPPFSLTHTLSRLRSTALSSTASISCWTIR